MKYENSFCAKLFKSLVINKILFYTKSIEGYIYTHNHCNVTYVHVWYIHMGYSYVATSQDHVDTTITKKNLVALWTCTYNTSNATYL